MEWSRRRRETIIIIIVSMRQWQNWSFQWNDKITKMVCYVFDNFEGECVTTIYAAIYHPHIWKLLLLFWLELIVRLDFNLHVFLRSVVVSFSFSLWLWLWAQTTAFVSNIEPLCLWMRLPSIVLCRSCLTLEDYIAHLSRLKGSSVSLSSETV